MRQICQNLVILVFKGNFWGVILNQSQFFRRMLNLGSIIGLLHSQFCSYAEFYKPLTKVALQRIKHSFWGVHLDEKVFQISPASLWNSTTVKMIVQLYLLAPCSQCPGNCPKNVKKNWKWCYLQMISVKQLVSLR